MDIVKIAAAGLITAVCALILRETRADMAIAVTLAGGVIILLMVLDKVVGIFTVFETLMQRAGIDNRIFSLLVKIIGIGYVTDFSAGVIEDTGSKSLADKVVLAGKIIIMTLALPVVVKLFDLIAGLLQ